MNMSVLVTILSCFSCCMLFYVVGGVHGDTAMDMQIRRSHKPEPSQPYRCFDVESSALLEFKQGITIERGIDLTTYHKTDSWRVGEDCCASWDGVECDQVTGHVIGLDLSGSDTSGSIFSGFIRDNTSLFQLIHLQKLNLSYNHLEGQVPSTIFHLSNLSSLDLSSYGLRLHKPDLKDLVHNLTKLEHVHLSDVNMTGSTLPDSLSNRSHLKSLHFSNCGLRGEFPSSRGIFRLPKLRVLDLSYNVGLTGHLPEFNGNNSLEALKIGSTSIEGELPYSIGELSFLKVLDISSCKFSGRLPSLAGLLNLSYLRLSGNGFTSQMFPPWFANLTQLVTLDLSGNLLHGQIPSSMSSMSKLEVFLLYSNHFTGSIPSSLANLTNLQFIDFSFNQFEGAIPNSISNLNKLRCLDLSSNNLNGTVELDMFHKLRDFSILKLSQNNLSLLVNEGTNSFVRDKYIYLGLGSCNLSKFPTFLLNQSGLVWLDLSQNNIHGMVPTWIWNNSLAMYALNISHNFLTTFEDHPFMASGSTLHTLDISFNALQGLLLVPPSLTQIYLASSNGFSGYLSPLFCNLSNLTVLDVSSNNVNGTIPHCLGTFGTSLSILNLRNNKLHGTIPQSWAQGSSLQMIALGQNQLEGMVPRSLGNCKMLEFIDFGNNKIVDTFPSWLADLPKLKVLMLQFNRFHGDIQRLEGNTRFPQLRIIDLSFNGFSGKLPSMYFQSMESLDADERMRYMEVQLLEGWSYLSLDSTYLYSMEITNKGMKMVYSKIPDIFRGIDFSHNQFEGEIPASITKLVGLRLLNLGHNNLTGSIPSWFGDLRQLESLDLSHNKLSGKIPQELRKLSFLAFFNVSYNNLSGIIPQGGQFDTFGNSSYEGNPGLLADLQTQSSILKTKEEEEEEEEEDDRLFDKTEWMVILIGCGGGLIVGVILGNEFFVRTPKWFVNLLGKLF